MNPHERLFPNAKPPTTERARLALTRVLNAALNRSGEGPKIRVPAEADDDDLVLGYACDALDARDAENARLRALLRKIDELFPPSTCNVAYVSERPCHRPSCVGCVAREALEVKS